MSPSCFPRHHGSILATINFNFLPPHSRTHVLTPGSLPGSFSCHVHFQNKCRQNALMAYHTLKDHALSCLYLSVLALILLMEQLKPQYHLPKELLPTFSKPKSDIPTVKMPSLHLSEMALLAFGISLYPDYACISLLPCDW